MNRLEFLVKLNKLFPMSGSDDTTNIKLRVFGQILKDKEKSFGRKFDYEKMLSLISETHVYANFPQMPQILSHIKFLPNSNDKSNTKKPRSFLVKRGKTEYIFEEAPESFDTKYSIADFEDIMEIVEPD